MEQKPAKPNSIFSAINPQPAAPPPAAAQALPPRPAVSEETANLLRQKIDSLEKNILAQLEKRLASPPAAAPQAAEAAFTMKLSELERRIEEFSRMAVLSASQMKNIEESKIGARREIEDLLKAVREQQKYSELDRQMHEQLEKSWARVEELEKKLMSFYSSLLDGQQKKSDDDVRLAAESASRLSAIEAKLSGLDSSIEKIMEVRLGSGLFAVLRQELEREFAARRRAEEPNVAAIREEVTRQAREFADRNKADAANIAAIREEVARQSREASAARQADAANMAAIREETARQAREASAARQAGETNLAAIREEAARMVREADTARQAGATDLAAIREEVSRQGRELAARIEDFRGAAESNRLRVEGVQEALARSARETAELLEAAFERAEEKARLREEEFLLRLRAEQSKHAAEQAAEFGRLYGDVLRGLGALDQARLLAGPVVSRVSELEVKLSSALGLIDPDRMPGMPGVSGMAMRRGFAELREVLSHVRSHLGALRALSDGVERSLGGPGKPD